MTLAITRAR